MQRTATRSSCSLLVSGLARSAASSTPTLPLRLPVASRTAGRRWSTFNNGLVEGFPGAVGNTPLIKLRSLSEETGCEIMGKAEFMKYFPHYLHLFRFQSLAPLSKSEYLNFFL
jgi:hypothetical protein